MINLTPATCRRLQQLPQPGESIWEGDRRSLPVTLEEGFQPECIFWVDGSQGVVRAMEMVSPEVGPEALVRALLKAMETPSPPSQPSRPQKIVVSDREIQFYLRGVLQNLDIDIEYRSQLPLIDHLFQRMLQEVGSLTPQTAPEYLTFLCKSAQKIWQVQPWENLADHQILSIEINQWDIEKLYVSILGMLGEQYGIILYRSLDSLKQFRQAALNRDTIEEMESALLNQDCFFINFDLKPDSSLADVDEHNLILGLLSWSEIEPSFGVIHPLEGLRTALYDQEPLVVMVALEALHRFFKAHRSQLSLNSFEALNQRFRIRLPNASEQEKASVLVTVETLPEVSEEFDAMLRLLEEEEDDEDDEDLDAPLLHDDLIPENTLCRLDILSWETCEQICEKIEFYSAVPEELRGVGSGLPVVILQMSKLNGKTVIEDLELFEGVDGIGFNLGEDPFTEKTFDLGVIKTGDGDLYLFEEFERTSAYQQKRKKWDNQCRNIQGYCGLVIAMGMRGESRGNPKPKDMLALLETKFLSTEDLGLGVLQKTRFLF